MIANHLEQISTKIISRTRLIRKIGSLNLNNHRELCMIIFKSQIRSILDYAFIPTLSPCQKISTKLQTLQNRALKSIKYFPLKTSTQHIHTFFKTERVKSRAASIARRFALSRLHHEQLANDYNSFRLNRNPDYTYKHKTIFETFRQLIPEIEQ